jgi:hypothetical protein
MPICNGIPGRCITRSLSKTINLDCCPASHILNCVNFESEDPRQESATLTIYRDMLSPSTKTSRHTHAHAHTKPI